jgi:hypothetical protein
VFFGVTLSGTQLIAAFDTDSAPNTTKQVAIKVLTSAMRPRAFKTARFPTGKNDRRQPVALSAANAFRT